MDDLMTRGGLPRPTAERPLLGLTVLAVEDSKYACEAFRLLCLRSGARIRRADSLRSARRHLQVYRPSVVLVDMGLPDGSGADLLEELATASPRVAVLLAISGDCMTEPLAQAAGADGFLEKPVLSLAAFQSAILAHLPADRRAMGPRNVPDDAVSPDPLAYRDDMAHAADMLGDISDARSVDFAARFLSGVARSANDQALCSAAEDLTEARNMGRPVHARIAQLAGLVQERLSDQVAI